MRFVVACAVAIFMVYVGIAIMVQHDKRDEKCAEKGGVFLYKERLCIRKDVVL